MLLYVGLSVDIQTRKRELVGTLLGMSISYDRVVSISTEIGKSVCRRFEEDVVWCSIELQEGLFQTSAIRNIGDNPNSNTAQGYFMEQAFPFSKIFLKVFQQPEAIVTANDTGSVTKSIRSSRR